MPRSRPAITITCHVRASSLVEPVDTTVERLCAFESSGAVDEVRVEAWPAEVPLEMSSEDSEIVDRYDSFRRWADRCGVDLEPAFTVRHRRTLVSEGTDAVLVLPVVCLAISVDGELASVVPHDDGETTYTVDDALADVEALDRAWPTAAPTATDRSAPGWATRPNRHCPACGAALTNGQGLYACPACSWVGSAPATAAPGASVADTAASGTVDGRDRDESDDSELRRADEREAPPST